MSERRKRWMLTAELVPCATILAFSTWVTTLPLMTYTQALKHSDTYFIWHSLVFHVAAVAVFAASFVMTIVLLAQLLATWSQVGAWWQRLLVLHDSRRRS